MALIGKKYFDNSWVELLIRWVLGLLFIYSSYHKILEPAHFAKVIYGYYLFPGATINLIAIILPFIELMTGLALITGIYPRSAALIILVMLVFFITAVSINMIRGVEFDCGCFSFKEAGDAASAWQVLIRDFLFFYFGLHVLFYGYRRKGCILQSGNILQNLPRSKED